MKLIDLLLLVAAAALVAAGWVIHPSLGCLALSVSAGAAWYLLGDES